MAKIKKSEFDAWMSHHVTCAVRNYLVSQIQDLDSLSNHPLIEENTYTNELTALEKVGCSVLLRSASIKGLEMFTDPEALQMGLEQAQIIGDEDE